MIHTRVPKILDWGEGHNLSNGSRCQQPAWPEKDAPREDTERHMFWVRHPTLMTPTQDP